ncbi:MAG: hypothetical protein ACWA44_02520 [Thiotrichales bacterium]
MEKTFSIIIPQNAGSEEITDTIYDVFKVAITVSDALADGFQLDDILKAIQLEPTVKEVINDFPVFLSQFVALDGATAMLAVEEAKARTIAEFGELGKVAQFAYDLLMQIARTYNFLQVSVVNGVEELNSWKSLLGQLRQPEAA